MVPDCRPLHRERDHLPAEGPQAGGVALHGGLRGALRPPTAARQGGHQEDHESRVTTERERLILS